MLFIDLDDFKLVNDSFGHAVGDELLVMVAKRLRESCRAGDVVARQGGDEFLVLVQGAAAEASPETAAQTVAANLRAALAKPFAVANTDLYVTPSIGASLFPVDGDTAETLLKHADIAMYAAKDGGRDGYRLYQPPKRDSSRELAIASQLRLAERRDELELYYQPIVDLAQSCIVGAEALIRWNHPEAGLLLPGAFLPAAERTGLIRPITAWVLERACIEARRWCDRDLDLYASVNLPPAYWQASAIRRVIATVESFGLTPDRIMIELTEQAAMTDITDLEPMLNEIHSQGLRLAIDDFGTGYSSLGRLRRLRPSMIKIDRSFVKDLPARPRRRRARRDHDHDGREARHPVPRRGHRDRGPAGLPARSRLRDRPGLPLQQAAADDALQRAALRRPAPGRLRPASAAGGDAPEELEERRPALAVALALGRAVAEPLPSTVLEVDAGGRRSGRA